MSSNAWGEAWLCFATQNETVNALKRCPRRELRTTWPAKPLIDRRVQCVDERAEPSAISGTLYMILVGLRRSPARIRVIHVTEQLSVYAVCLTIDRGPLIQEGCVEYHRTSSFEAS